MNYLEKLREKKNYVPKVNLPALARRHPEFMSCFVARPGHIFVSQDVVALEPTITAEFSKDKRYRYAVVDGIGKPVHYDRGILMIDDIYLMTGSRLPPTKDATRKFFDDGLFKTWHLMTPEEQEKVKDITKKTVRGYAKTSVLGFGYGMGWKKFQKTAKEAKFPITADEAKDSKKEYWASYPGLAQLRDRLSWECKKYGSLVNPFGYRLTPEPHKALNAFIQSSASGVMDVYGSYLFHDNPHFHFIGLIHDEFIVEIPLTAKEEFVTKSAEALRDTNKLLNWECPIRLGTKFASTFAEFK